MKQTITHIKTLNCTGNPISPELLHQEKTTSQQTYSSVFPGLSSRFTEKYGLDTFLIYVIQFYPLFATILIFMCYLSWIFYSENSFTYAKLHWLERYFSTKQKFRTATHITSLRKVALWLNFRVYKIKAYSKSVKKYFINACKHIYVYFYQIFLFHCQLLRFWCFLSYFVGIIIRTIFHLFGSTNKCHNSTKAKYIWIMQSIENITLLLYGSLVLSCNPTSFSWLFYFALNYCILHLHLSSLYWTVKVTSYFT